MSEQELEDKTPLDGDFHTPLDRVNFEAGMMLGVAATRTEQQYHRQRLNRHQYWLHGTGTVVGLGVTMEYETPPDTESDMTVHLVVSPGVGVDRLGREVTSYEPYCVNLREWLEAQLATDAGLALLRDGLESDGNHLSLLITMRYRGCDAGLQPVMARKVNAGTDPVQPSRTRDSLMLEIVPGTPPDPDLDWFWPAQHPDSETETLNDTEQAYLGSLDSAWKQLRAMQGRLVYALPNTNRALESDADPDALARTLLAQVRIELRDDSDATPDPIVNPDKITINNLVRPFVTTPEQLAWMSRHVAWSDGEE